VGALERLDGWAEQYPEFVEEMQELLAERMILSVEADVLEKEIENGAVSHSLGNTMLEELRRKIRRLTYPTLSIFHESPLELLKNVPFLSGISSDDLSALSNCLRQRNVPSETKVVIQGEPGSSMYLIAKGVVRVSKQSENENRKVATLIAGDYFGEVAFLTSRPRNATCKSVTACTLYELSRQSFNALCDERPTLNATLEIAANT